MKPLLSIITPVYNVRAFLERCVLSILTQPYNEIELVLIDDGSTDGSSALCDEWSERDNRIVVIHNENGGASSARNVGLEVAKGDYLTFVDADDFIAPDTYQINMNYLLDHKEVDIVQFPYCNYISDDDIIDYHKSSPSLLIGNEEIFRNWWSGSPLEYVCWNKIYKRHLWNDVRFWVGHTSEDTRLVSDFVKRARSVYISEYGLYYYQRARKDSYTYEYDFAKHLDLFYAHAAIYECFQMFPNMVTEKVLAFTRLYRRLITAKQNGMLEDIHVPQDLISRHFPTWYEILSSRHTEKLWLSISKILGTNLFIKMFIKYLNS